MSRAKTRAPATQKRAPAKTLPPATQKRAPAKTLPPAKKQTRPRRKPPPASAPPSRPRTDDRETWIADMRVVWVDPDGARRPGRVAVGALYEQDGYSMCRMLIDFERRTWHPIAGYDYMQALLLVVRLIGYELFRFTSTGGRVVYPDGAANAGTDIDLDAVFGPLLQMWLSE